MEFKYISLVLGTLKLRIKIRFFIYHLQLFEKKNLKISIKIMIVFRIYYYHWLHLLQYTFECLKQTAKLHFLQDSLVLGSRHFSFGFACFMFSSLQNSQVILFSFESKQAMPEEKKDSLNFELVKANLTKHDPLI